MDQAAKQGPLNFALVEVDPHVVAALSAEPADGFPSQLTAPGGPARAVIGVGDTISVEIWDSPNGSLFGPTPGEISPGTLPSISGASGARRVSIPEQIVGPDGAVSVPFAGRVKAANRTTYEVQQTIQQLLAKTSFEPQVLVTITKSVSRDVTVSGETMSGMRVPLTSGGERLLDVIAAAGGTKSAPYETAVRLVRRGYAITIPMSNLISDPRANIYAMPGDTITVVKAPRTFSVFGATLNNAQIPFGAEHVSLAQAVAKAGGLQDLRADPEGVFLLRLEPPTVVRALGLKASEAEQTPDRLIPVVYHVNLRDVSGYFLAGRLDIRNDDILYVANAPVNDIQKVANLIGTIASPVINGVIVGSAFKK
jgi:polysaccharide biosynthesis/export protein